MHPHVVCRYSLRRVLATDKVVDNIGVTNALLDRLGVTQIVFLWESDIVRHESISRQRSPYYERNTSKITSNLQVTLPTLLAVGNNDVASLLSCGMSVLSPLIHRTLIEPRHTKVVDNVATEETGSTKDGRGVA